VRLQKDLAAKGFDVWLDQQRADAGASWTIEIERAIDRAGVVLAVLTESSYDSAICRAEHLRSLRKGKKVIPLLAQTDADVPLYIEPVHYLDFDVSGNYAVQLQRLLEDLAGDKGGVTLRPEYHTTLVTTPPLPLNYLPRPEALERLRDAVVTDRPGPSVALIALEGMGGIGKTILAQALSQDDAVQNAFPDGIVWSTVGKEPVYSLISRMQEVRRALGDEPTKDESELHCIDRYRTVLQAKAALVIVDDVWRSEDIAPFLARSRRSKLLFTTRSTGIAGETGARPHTAELLTIPQSRALLARWADYKPEVSRRDALPPEADGLASECGRLPLALSMVGAMLRGKPLPYWSHVLTLLKQADLKKIRAQFPLYPHADMLRAIQVSIEALDDSDRSRYLDLAVLLDGMAAASAVQRTLWNVDAGEALETAERFVSFSLAQRDGISGIRLHDLQLDYVRAQYSERDALELIHGAVRLSAHVIEKDPQQFASQVIGRLLPHRDAGAIQQFIAKITVGSPHPWIRLLQPALHPPGTALLRTLEGHYADISGVAVTPDGTRAISASADKTLKVWGLDSGCTLRTLEGHSDGVSGVAVTPDGTRAVSASRDKTLKVWNLDTGRAMRTLEGHSAAVFCVALTRDGHRAVSASADATLKVWDLDSGSMLRTLEGHSDYVFGVAVMPDGTRVVSASWDKTLKIWDLNTGCTLRTLAGHSDYVYCVTVMPDGRRALSTSRDNTLRLWDLDTGRVLRTLKGHSASVYGVAVTPDGRRAVSTSRDNTLKLWDLDGGRVLSTLEGHSDSVSGVALTADGNLAISASDDKTLKVWDLDTDRGLRTPRGHSDSVSGVAVTPDGKRAVSASADKTLKLWDLETGRALRTLEGHAASVTGVAVTPGGNRAVSAFWDNTLNVWEIESGRTLLTLKGHSDSVCGVAVTDDGERAVSASRDKTLKVWNLENGRTLHTLEGHSAFVFGVAVTPDGKRAVSASADKTLKVWDLDSGRTLRTLKGHSAVILGVAVTPDGHQAVSASADKTLKVWDLDSGCTVRTLEGHSDYVSGVAVTPDGTRAVSVSRDKTLNVWDLGTGILLATFHCDAPARCCACVDKRRMVAGDGGGRVYILSLEESGAVESGTKAKA